MPRCAVVVVNYGSHALLERNLVPLHLEEPELDVVVVDNFTTHDEQRAVRRLGEQYGWTVVAETENRGFGAGVNRGAYEAFSRGAKQVLMLNPDAAISRASLARLREEATADPWRLVAPTIRTPEGRTWFAGSVVDLATGAVRRGDPSGPQETRWLSGACLLVSRTLWELVGGFDERYFLYWEDIDLSYRVQQAGGRLEVVGDAVATHDQGGTQHTRTARAKSDAYYYYMVRGRLLFCRTHLPTIQRMRWQVTAPRYAWGVVLHGGRRQLLHSVNPVLSAARGVRDGVLSPGKRRNASTGGGSRPKPLVVLQSVPRPLPTTNPYNVMLADALAAHPAIDLRMFSWREALLHRHDVFHAHWPESLVVRRDLPKTVLRRLLFGALLVKWRLVGTAVVRTVHNVEGPSGISRFEQWMLADLERRTTGRITLNPFTRVGSDHPVQLVVHGHYRPWFAGFPEPEIVRGRLAFFGMIRRYKGVDTLVEAFRASDRADLTLSVAGKPSSRSLADDLVRTADGDRRITISFDFLDTAALVAHVGRAELVVLPHTEMHNSGSAIAALSLDRPVLMQDNVVNRWLRDEVGPGWVQLYDGDLTSDALSGAIDALRAAPPRARPDLTLRDWTRVADLHADLYRAAQRDRRADAVARDASRDAR
ncbi:glycosyltransferase [Allobranchiibius sp. CTAmp26]|nr:glycosyltransferase [Allobranchiibius sp. CTAmp26]